MDTELYFDEPVSKKFKHAPNFVSEYESEISHPMDFSTIKQNICDLKFENNMSFHEAMCLIFENAMRFNDPESNVYLKAEQCTKLFQHQWQVMLSSSLMARHQRQKERIPRHSTSTKKTKAKRRRRVSWTSFCEAQSLTKQECDYVHETFHTLLGEQQNLIREKLQEYVKNGQVDLQRIPAKVQQRILRIVKHGERIVREQSEQQPERKTRFRSGTSRAPSVVSVSSCASPNLNSPWGRTEQNPDIQLTPSPISSPALTPVPVFMSEYHDPYRDTPASPRPLPANLTRMPTAELLTPIPEDEEEVLSSSDSDMYSD